MLTRLKVGKFSLAGVSVGGVYTTIAVPELDVILDVGIAPRSFVGAKNLFLSHGHADHVGAFVTMLGIRGLSRAEAPRTFLPAELHLDLEESVNAMNRAQRRGLKVSYVPVLPGEVHQVQGDLFVRILRTRHTIPSVGYEFFRKVDKLREEFRALAPAEIRDRRSAGEDLFTTIERAELAYATDTLIDVLDETPSLYESGTLILECTFLDERKGRGECREKGHIHLDDILERASLFQNEHLVLMHFSQLYKPSEVHEILRRRLPAGLRERVAIFAPSSGAWPG